MGFLHNYRQRHVGDRLVAMGLLAGGLVIATAGPAFGAAALTLSKSSGLSQAQVVSVSGSGLSGGSYGYLLECNDTPGEPTVTVGPPFDSILPVGCSAPNLKHIVHTTAGGTLLTSFRVHESRKLGPPCGLPQVLGPCGHPDSARKGPRGDAQNYPCPPSPAQQAAGITCSIVFLDNSQDVVSTPIAFVGGGPPVKTSPGAPGATPPGAPGTTSPGSSPGTTSPGGSQPGAQPGTQPAGASSGGTPSGGSSSASGGSASSGTPGVVKASSGSLAFTGLGKPGVLVAVVGFALVLIGLLLFFFDIRKIAWWLLGL